MEKKLEKPGEGYQVLHRSFNSALGQEGYSLYLASKYIGVYHYRSHVGDPGNRLPFEPVPAAKQKEALELLREHLFSPPAFRFSPQLLNKLASPRHSNFVDFLAMRTRFEKVDRKSTRLNSSHTVISYAVFCLKKKKK